MSHIFFPRRYQDAWDIGIILADTQEWIEAATFALKKFNIEFGNYIKRF